MNDGQVKKLNLISISETEELEPADNMLLLVSQPLGNGMFKTGHITLGSIQRMTVFMAIMQFRWGNYVTAIAPHMVETCSLSINYDHVTTSDPKIKGRVWR